MSDLEAALADLRTGDDHRADNAVQILAALGEEAIPTILGELSADEPDRRCWAIATLAGIRSPAADEALIRSLRDPDPEVRRCAVWGLHDRPNSTALPHLLSLLYANDRLLARQAGDTIQSYGILAVEPLSTAARSEHHGARIEATRALARMNLAETVPILLELLDDASPHVQFWAEDGLQRNDVGMVFLPPQ